MNVGDLEPDWIVDITADPATNFTPATWRFDAYRATTDGLVLAFTDSAPDHTLGATTNVISIGHNWVAGQTATAGVLHGVPVATWAGGREQSFPGATIEITAP